MNKKFVGAILVSLLLCAVNNSNGMLYQALNNQTLNNQKNSKASSNLAIAATIKAATHIAKESILKDSTQGKILDEAATVNGLLRIFPGNERNFKYRAENVGSCLTSAAVVTARHQLSKTSVGKKIEECFDGSLKSIKKPCKYFVEAILARFFWTNISNM